MNQVVLDRKIKASESRFNPKFLDFAEYYGIVIRLCYQYRSETLGRGEHS
jgi:transposase